ncbi:MAG: LysE family transporter [Hyphomicrobium sp.]
MDLCSSRQGDGATQGYSRINARTGYGAAAEMGQRGNGVTLLLKAFLAGFVVAMPVGAVGALCLRRGLQHRWVVGVATGIGAAVADGVLAGTAIYGISLITGYLLDNEVLFRLGGGLFLLALGVHMSRQREAVACSAEKAAIKHRDEARHITGAVATGFVLTIINPATLLAFIGIFAALGLVDEKDHRLAAEMIVVGVAMGSLLWWITLTIASVAMRKRIPFDILRTINGVLGVTVAALGALSLLSLLHTVL